MSFCSSARSERAIDDVPAPAGEESTSITPRRNGPFASAGIAQSLQVLDLLAQLVDDRLQFEADCGQGAVAGLGAGRGDFAIELLSEEVEPASDRPALGEQCAGRLDMSLQ